MYKTNAILDNGAVQGAMSESKHQKVTTTHLEAVLREKTAPSLELS